MKWLPQAKGKFVLVSAPHLTIVPGLVLALGVAVRLHPVMVGIVLALAAQAAFAHRNLGRVERVNAASLGGSG